MRRPTIAVAPFALALALTAAGGYDGRAEESGVAYHRELVRYEMPQVTLVDSRGRSVAVAAELKAEPRPVILQFMFTTCAGVCPLLSAVLAQAQDELDRAALWSITIDPEADSPEQLRLYATALDAAQGWRFFTGPLDDIVAVQRAFEAYADNKMRHRPLTFIRPTGNGTWLRLEGVLSAAELVAEYRRLTEP